MRNYIPDAGLAGLSTDVSFDVSAFDGLELIQELNEIFDQNINPMWSIGVGGTILTTPVIDSGMIYFGACDKTFYALSLDGRKVWEFETGDANVSPACIVDDMVIFGSLDFNLYALDKFSGNLLWRFGAKDKIRSEPATDGKSIFFGSRDGNVYCLDKKGGLLWRFSTGGPVTGYPLLHRGVLYIGSDDKNLYALEPETGKMLWRFGTNSPIRFNMVAWEDVIYFTDMEGMICGVNTKGQRVFSFKMNDSGTIFACIDDGVLYVPSRDYNVYAIRTDGSLVWRFRTGQATVGTVVHGGHVYFGSGDNNIYALDKETGKFVWKYATRGFVFSCPAIHDNVLFMGCWDCNMYALDAETGRLLWKFRTKLSNQSEFIMDELRPEKQLEVVWNSESEVVEEKKYSAQELGDYGVVGSDYASGMSKSYMSGKKNYI